jgi:hypothetical protein
MPAHEEVFNKSMLNLPAVGPVDTYSAESNVMPVIFRRISFCVRVVPNSLTLPIFSEGLWLVRTDPFQNFRAG